MTMQKLLSKTRQAINDFNMINDNDKIAVGLSGGKDSVTLLHILKNYQKFSPQKFELIAITLNPGGVDNGPLHELCKKLDVPFYEIQTDIAKIVFDIRKEKCYLLMVALSASMEVSRPASTDMVRSSISRDT